jgi:hypothetical protein
VLSELAIEENDIMFADFLRITIPRLRSELKGIADIRAACKLNLTESWTRAAQRETGHTIEACRASVEALRLELKRFLFFLFALSKLILLLFLVSSW